jgi:hypothetical protein
VTEASHSRSIPKADAAFQAVITASTIASLRFAFARRDGRRTTRTCSSRLQKFPIPASQMQSTFDYPSSHVKNKRDYHDSQGFRGGIFAEFQQIGGEWNAPVDFGKGTLRISRNKTACVVS